METQPVRLALVGLGGHGRRIQEAVSQVPALQVVGVYDPNENEASAAAQHYGCEAAPSYEALLEAGNLDAITLVTPNTVHREQAEAALLQGLDVFVEKPIANTVEDGKAMVEAANATGRILMVGHNLRRGRAARLAKKIIDAKTIGEVVSTEIHYSADNIQKGTHTGWRFEAGQCPMLPMMQLGIHAIDLVHYLLGPIRTVYAHTRSYLVAAPILDNVTSLLVFENGLAGTAISNYCTPDLFQVRVACTEGIMEINWIPHGLNIYPRGMRTEEPVFYDFSTFDLEDLVDQMKAFAVAIQMRIPPETDGRNALHALSVVEAMQTSAQTGSPVEIIS